MQIGIIADTHDHVINLKKAIGFFKEKGVDMVIHAGDYCSPFTIPHFEGLNLHGIVGNNDGDRFMLMKKFEEIGATLHGEFARLEADGLKIAVYHGTYPDITAALEKSGLFDVVISGHTHEAKYDTIDNTISINPGSCHGFEGEAIVALLNTKNRRVSFKELG